MSKSHVLLLTGLPGVGKTTIIRKVVASLHDRKIGGFFTGEIREGRVRRGFHITTFDGRERVMADVDLPKVVKVGKYGVDVQAVNATSDEALTLSDTVDVYLVDEIGKMECSSSRFVDATQTLLDSKKPVVATIAQRGVGFIAAVKRRPDVEEVGLPRCRVVEMTA
jgi:nucleoside-triphosphatase